MKTFLSLPQGKKQLILFFLFFTPFIFAETKTDIKGVPFGDPFILLHADTYYAYGTNAEDGIEVFISDDLFNWSRPEGVKNGLALHKDDVWGDRWFWAPEVYYVKGKFYMYYTADEHICVATSDSPLGPFRQERKEPMLDEKCIDNSLFIDDDGKPYVFFDRFNEGLNIWVAELTDDLLNIRKETMHSCIKVSQEWEKVWPTVNEGPYVIKRNGIYYMTYSANSYESPFYGIGYATTTDIMGKWEKYEENPILQKPGGLVGIGHSATFTDKGGNLKITFHAHNSKEHIHPREMYISDVSFRKKDGKEYMEISKRIMKPRLLDRKPDKYHNPVVNYSLPDPTIIKAEDGYFYLYATEDIRNLPIHRSKNLIDWEFTGTAFTNETRPDFEPKGGIWAPDINYINGQYILYYSMSVWGKEWTCGIGVAVADKPEGPFRDLGILFRSNTINVQNSIDPFYIEEKGKKYLFWGSFRGIYGIELAKDGLSVRKKRVPRRIAGTAYEGTYIHKKDGYYYLFASIGSCCEGLNSTYTTVVGRSHNLWGPYTDKQGNGMLENNHEVLIGKNEYFVGNGHNSEIVTDDSGGDWIFYHGVSTFNPYGRVLLMDKIEWKDGWPEVAGTSPSLESQKPFFKTVR